MKIIKEIANILKFSIFLRGVLLPGAPNPASWNYILSAFLYNRKPNFFAECAHIVPASVPRKNEVELILWNWLLE